MNNKDNDSEYLFQILEFLDNNSKMITELTGIAKDVASKNPAALDGNFAEYFIRSSFGDKMYETIQSTYHAFIRNDAKEISGGE